MKLKYVIINEAFPILFGEYFKHSDFASGHGKVTSAGFVTIKEIETPEGSPFCVARMLQAGCYGESVSLGVKSDPEWDQKLIERVLNH